MDRDALELQARFAAIEYLLMTVVRSFYVLASVPADGFLAKHKEALDKIDQSTVVKTDDPAISDLVSGETRLAVLRLLRGVEEMMGIPEAQRSR